jgi:hypothetical protein
MAFSHGKDAKVFANGRRISDYLRSFSTPASRDQAESSTYISSWKAYTAGMIETTFAASGIFDGGTAAVDEQLQATFGTTGAIWTFFPYGSDAGKYGYGWAASENSYEIDAPVDDVVSVSVECVSASGYGRQRVRSLHDEQTARSTSGTSSSQDNGTATALGGAAYLHVPAFSGSGTATIKIQDSANDSTYADLFTFAAVTAAGTAQRIELAAAGTVARYTRVVWTLTGSPTINFSASHSRR